MAQDPTVQRLSPEGWVCSYDRFHRCENPVGAHGQCTRRARFITAEPGNRMRLCRQHMKMMHPSVAQGPSQSPPE